MQKFNPRSADEAYRTMMDKLVEHSRFSATARWVRKGGLSSTTARAGPINALLAALTPEHRETLAAMLEEERTGGIHDTLVDLEWWVNCGDVAMTIKGEPININRYETPHGDFIGRLNGWEWPV